MFICEGMNDIFLTKYIQLIDVMESVMREAEYIVVCRWIVG